MVTETENISIRPHEGPQEAFLSSTADIVIYGGAAGGGKTWGLLMEPLRHIRNGQFSAVILRKTFPQIRNEGGLWDESEGLYPLLGAEPVLTRLEWEFPSGMTVRFAHLDHEKDKYDWQGAQIPLIGFDELTHFSESQFFYMLSRNRSVCGVKPYVRATCNPDADSWVAELIDWWIDGETGLPIAERSGIVRWFVRDGGSIRWGESEEQMRERFPELEAKSLTFIPANLEDNPTLCESDPGYKANLMAMRFVDRERLYAGNWLVGDNDGAYWEEYPEYFAAHIWSGDDWPDTFDAAVIALDPSLAKTDKSDLSALVFAGLAGGKIWVDADIERRPAERMAEDCIGFYHGQGFPQAVGIEGVAFQQVLKPYFDLYCQHNSIPPLPIELLFHTRSINNDGQLARSKLGSKARIASLGAYLKNKQLRFRSGSEGVVTLIRQLRNFGIKNYPDDGPDALEMAIRLLRQVAMGEQTAPPAVVTT